MRILLLGNTGQLGWELERNLQAYGNVLAKDYPAINMADENSIRKLIRENKPEIIFNATAYTAVDKAESEPELANVINGNGPGILAEEAKRNNAFLIHYSTDYVFDGMKGALNNERDLPNPLNVYGESKLRGEQLIKEVDGNFLIFRTSWVYSFRRDNFVAKVLKWSRNNESMNIVDDQIGNPTSAYTLAKISSQILTSGLDYLSERKGLYHLAGGGYATRLEWAKEILRLDPQSEEQIVKELLPAKTSDFPTAAKRPLFSALDCGKFENTFGLEIPKWQQVLRL
jgi:dTDP-4-dehydrorhamnose reductase